MGTAANHPIGPALKPHILVPPFFRHRAVHAHVLDVHATMYVARLQSIGWHLDVYMSVDTLVWDVLFPTHETF